MIRLLCLLPLAALIGLAAGAASAGTAAPGSSVVVAKVKVGGQPCGVVGTPSGVWVADYAGNRLVRIDPDERRLDRVDRQVQLVGHDNVRTLG